MGAFLKRVEPLTEKSVNIVENQAFNNEASHKCVEPLTRKSEMVRIHVGWFTVASGSMSNL